MSFSPAIIVQGGGFLESASCDKYRHVTETAANVGYDILMVSVINIYMPLIITRSNWQNILN